MLARRTLLGGMLLPVLLRPVQALESKAAIAALNRADLAKELSGNPERIVLSDWGSEAERLTACAILNQDNDSVIALLLREEQDGHAEIVSGPGEMPAIKIDPFWSVTAEILRESPLGRAPAIVAVKVNNGYTSTSRSTWTESLHFFLRRDKALVPVFASFTRAAHSEGKVRWNRVWRLAAQGTVNAAGVPPRLVVRDNRTGAVVSRHRWRDDAYHPPTFERTPSLGPG